MANNNEFRENGFREKRDNNLLTTRKFCNEAFVIPKGKSRDFLERFKAKKTGKSSISFWEECKTVTQKTNE